MSDLDRRLRELRGEVEWPATPDLAAAVHARIAQSPTPARRRPPLFRPLPIALAAVLVLAGGAFAAVPDFRDAVLDALGIGGVDVERVPEQPRAPVRGADLGLGRPASLDQARAAVRWRVLAPRSYDQVWLSPSPVGGQVAFTGDGLLLTEFRGDETRVFIGKALGPGTEATEVGVHGSPGVWLTGDPHQFLYRDARGRVRQETVRLAGNVLLWERGGLTLRLEGARTLDEARAYAATLR